MKNNSNSSFKIKQLMMILPVIILMTTAIQLFTNIQGVTEIANVDTIIENKIENEIETQEEIQLASKDTSDKKEKETVTVTSRSGMERILVEAQYKGIDDIKISRDMNLTESCGISKDSFKELLKNVRVDTSKFFYNNSDIIYDLCQEYKLNELFFCGLIAGESGWGIAQNHRNAHNYISMMSGGKLIRYASVEDGLEAAAKLLHTKYLSEDGVFYCGKTLSSVQKRFCPNSSTWVNLIYTAMKTMIE